MTIKPQHESSYTHLLKAFEEEQQSNLPKNMRGYIERHNQPPINAFLNISLRNHQNLLTRVGHISLSLLRPIQLDILAWAYEQQGEPDYLHLLRDELELELIQVSDTRTLTQQSPVSP